MRRRAVNKMHSARQFRRNTRKTKSPNVAGPMRGGIRF